MKKYSLIITNNADGKTFSLLLFDNELIQKAIEEIYNLETKEEVIKIIKEKYGEELEVVVKQK